MLVDDSQFCCCGKYIAFTTSHCLYYALQSILLQVDVV